MKQLFQKINIVPNRLIINSHTLRNFSALIYSIKHIQKIHNDFYTHKIYSEYFVTCIFPHSSTNVP